LSLSTAASCGLSSASVDPRSSQRQRVFRSSRAGGDLAMAARVTREISAAQLLLSAMGERIPVDRTPARVCLANGSALEQSDYAGAF